MRSARSRTWLVDSSPETTRAGSVAPCAQRCATSSSSVDLPTPGSPASRITAPGTRPPPSTRSSSPTPVGRARAASALMVAIGRAGCTGARGLTARTAAGTAAAPAASITEFHPPHSGHRPTHLGGRYPQTSHS
jgi:hypothetical protein